MWLNQILSKNDIGFPNCEWNLKCVHKYFVYYCILLELVAKRDALWSSDLCLQEVGHIQLYDCIADFGCKSYHSFDASSTISK